MASSLRPRCLGALLVSLLGCARAPDGEQLDYEPYQPLRAPPPEVVDLRGQVGTAWPSALARLTPPELPPRAPRSRRLRVYLDAGHGARNNSGCVSVFCEDEQEHTLRVAELLAAQLRATGRFEVKLSRSGEGQPSYKRRVAEANDWPADALISLHADWRGTPTLWRPGATRTCLREDSSPGFAVLHSEDAPDELKARRLRLARAVARAMAVTGFTAYDGADYTGLYEGDAEQPGVFADRHPPGSRIYLLRRPAVPSIIVETHHALDVREASRWRDRATVHAFGRALMFALLESSSGAAGPGGELAGWSEATPRR